MQQAHPQPCETTPIPPGWKKILTLKHVVPHYVMPAFEHPPPAYTGKAPVQPHS